MPVPTTFLATCRTAIAASAEWTAFTAAGALSGTATRAARKAQWAALYAPGTTGTSVAGRLRKAIREIVNAKADTSQISNANVITVSERETCYATLVAEYVPVVASLPSDDAEYDDFLRLQKEDVLT